MVHVEALREAARTAANTDHSSATDDDLCATAIALEQARTLIDTISLTALAELDNRKTTDTHTGLTTGPWLARQTHQSTNQCRTRVRAARTLQQHLPHTAAALADGTISYDHVRVLTRACRTRIAHAITELEPELIELARGMVFDAWRRQIENIVELLDHNTDTDPNNDPDNNQLSITNTIDGITNLNCTLTGTNAATVTELVNNKADELLSIPPLGGHLV